MHSKQENFFCFAYFIFQSLCQLIDTSIYYSFFIQQLCNFNTAIIQKPILICKLCFTNQYLSRESSEKIAIANIQPYFVDLARNYSFALSLYHFLLNVMLKEQSLYDTFNFFASILIRKILAQHRPT